MNLSHRGVKQTVGVSGTGVSHSTYLFDDDHEENTRRKQSSRKKQDADAATKDQGEVIETSTSSRRRTPGWVLFLGIVFIHLGALVLGLMPTNFLSQVLGTLLEWTQNIGL